MLLERSEDPVVTVRSRDGCSISPDDRGKDAKRPPPSALRKALSFFYTFLLIFAVEAALVGGFMMFNTFSITVAQLRGRTGCSARWGQAVVRSCPQCSLRPSLSTYSHLFSASRRFGDRDRAKEPARRGRSRHPLRRPGAHVDHRRNLPGRGNRRHSEAVSRAVSLALGCRAGDGSRGLSVGVPER
jgi:hypothetical protein